MNFELIDQTIQYTFTNAKYKDGLKDRTFRNVKKGSAAADLAQVGKTIAGLQDDTLGAAVLIQKQGIPLLDQE